MKQATFNLRWANAAFNIPPNSASEWPRTEDQFLFPAVSVLLHWLRSVACPLGGRFQEVSSQALVLRAGEKRKGSCGPADACFIIQLERVWRCREHRYIPIEGSVKLPFLSKSSEARKTVLKLADSPALLVRPRAGHRLLLRMRIRARLRLSNTRQRPRKYLRSPSSQSPECREQARISLLSPPGALAGSFLEARRTQIDHESSPQRPISKH